MDYTFNSNDVIDRLSGETKNLVVFEVMFKGSIEKLPMRLPFPSSRANAIRTTRDRR